MYRTGNCFVFIKNSFTNEVANDCGILLSVDLSKDQGQETEPTYSKLAVELHLHSSYWEVLINAWYIHPKLDSRMYKEVL